MNSNESCGICIVTSLIDGHTFVFAFDDTAEARAATRVEITRIRESGGTPLNWEHVARLQREVSEALPMFEPGNSEATSYEL